MMEEYIYWVVSPENKPLRIIWVDDAFFPPDNLTQDIKVNRNRNNVPNIGKVWIDNFLDNYQDDDPDDLPDALPNQAKWLLLKKNMCQEKNIGFGVTSFKYGEEHIDELNTDKTLFLIDAQNINVLSSLNSELYGYQFVKNNQLPRERVMYYTRNSDKLDIKGIRKQKFPDIKDQDFIIPSSDNTKSLESWVDSFLKG